MATVQRRKTGMVQKPPILLNHARFYSLSRVSVILGQDHNMPPRWQMIPTESQLSFTPTQNNVPVKGQFRTFSASIFFDLKNLKGCHINIVIDMNSLEVSYAALKTTLTSPEWFAIVLFPKAEFKATQFTKAGFNLYNAIGTLTIRDKSIPTTLSFTAIQASPD